MRRYLYDIREITDSKEIYMSRPGIIYSLFIYIIFLILLVGVIYISVGTIDNVVRANGVVRPNEDISTVSSMIGGRVDEIYYYDGQAVKKGDKLLSVDMSESKIVLDGLRRDKKDLKEEIKLLKKYIIGVNEGKNPFSADIKGEEYRYYVMFREYILNLKKISIASEYSNIKNTNILKKLVKEKKSKRYDLHGYRAYRDSIVNDENLAKQYPEYSRLYELYVRSVKALDNNYRTQKREIEKGTLQESNDKYIEYYRKELSKYETLIGAIRDGVLKFDIGDNSYQKYLFDEYQANFAEYQRMYDNALATEKYYLEKSKEDDETKKLFELELIRAGSQVLSARNNIDIYRASKIAEYKERLNNLIEKYEELKIAENGTTEKAELLDELNETYNNTREQQKLKTLSDIDAAIKQNESEIKQIEIALSERKILQSEHKRNIIEGGNLLETELIKAGEIKSIEDKIEAARDSIAQLNTNIKSAGEQINEGSIVAEQDGTVNLIKKVGKGDIVDSGAELATIIPTGENKYKVILYIHNSDIAGIKIGNTIKYNLLALPASKYGSVSGKIEKISKDTIVREGTYSGYYAVEGTIESLRLKDRQGNIGEVTIGMEIEAKIVTEKKTILRHILEKIDLW